MKRTSTIITILFLPALVLGTVSCGGDDASTGTTAAPEPTDEEFVAELSEDQISALNRLDFAAVYEALLPSYRSRVTLEEFESFLRETYAPILPTVESGEAEVELTDMEVTVEGDYAYMAGDLGLDGTVLLEYSDESPDIWQKIDGTWYNLETDPSFPGYDAEELPEQFR